MKTKYILLALALFMISLISCEDEGGMGGSKNHPPAAPTTPTPVNGATNIDTTATFSWSCTDTDDDDLTYKFFLSTDNATFYRLNPAYFVSPQITITGGLSFNTTYYWAVKAFDGRDSAQSAIWHFTTRSNPPQMSISPTSLDFGSSATSLTFNITNAGSGSFNWSISDDQSWITVSPTSGTTTSETDQITVTVSRGSLSTGSYSGTITITPSVGSAQTVSVSMQVGSSGQPNLTIYTGSGSTNTYTYNTSTHILTVTWSIINSSTVTAGAFRAGLYVSTNTIISTSDYLLATATYSSGLLANYYSVIDYPAIDLDPTSVPYGTYYVGILIDDLYQVSESNESDNTGYMTPAIVYSSGMAKWTSQGIMPKIVLSSNATGALKSSSEPVVTVQIK
jgi:hypothetical protein